jgi:hypothetical protein
MPPFAANLRSRASPAPLVTRCLSKQEITMEKSRIVAVLRKARGLRKDKSGKTVITARLAARNKAPNSKWQNAPAQVTQAPKKASVTQTTASEANRSEPTSRQGISGQDVSPQDVSLEGSTPAAPE